MSESRIGENGPLEKCDTCGEWYHPLDDLHMHAIDQASYDRLLAALKDVKVVLELHTHAHSASAYIEAMERTRETLTEIDKVLEGK
jgi:hypothetical protein